MNINKKEGSSVFKWKLYLYRDNGVHHFIHDI